METQTAIPQFEKSKPQFSKSTSVRLTANEWQYLPIIQKATGSPNTASVMRLLLNVEHQEMKDGKRQASDLLIPADVKSQTFTFKLSEDEFYKLIDLKEFYSAPTQSAVCSHLVERMINVLESGKAGD